MPRSKKEWVGKSDDAMPPKTVRLRIFHAHGGRCHITGQQIRPGDEWHLDHLLALEDGGENREKNLAPALGSAHRKKTAKENSSRALLRRAAASHFGIKTAPHRPIQSRDFMSGRQKRTEKPSLPPRQIFVAKDSA